eukprot:COSAG02_NODE_1564_length_11912_cov_7.524676_8_plen_76_part_00
MKWMHETATQHSTHMRSCEFRSRRRGRGSVIGKIIAINKKRKAQEELLRVTAGKQEPPNDYDRRYLGHIETPPQL